MLNWLGELLKSMRWIGTLEEWNAECKEWSEKE